MGNYLYKIKNADGKYYKGRSKWNERGNYFDSTQLINILKWMLIRSEYNIQVELYDNEYINKMDIKELKDIDDLNFLGDRNRKIKKIIK